MRTDIQKIPEYSKEDFLKSSAPYEFLYSFKDNPFVLNQMCQAMKEKAGAVGVRCFMALYKAYCQSIAQQGNIITENSTQFDGQEIELVSGRYICDEYGVTTVDKFGFQVVVCRHPIMPVQRLVNIDSGEERMKIAYKKGNQWKSIIVEKSVIASSSSILQLANNGILVNSENAKYLSSYLMDIEQDNYNAIDEQKSVGRLGWVGDYGFAPYFDGLVFDGETNFKHIFGAVKQEGSYDVWLDKMRDLRRYGIAGRLFLAASFASVILKPCGLLPFFFHAWGGTESGKTVGLMVSASVWASPRLGDFVLTFNSTGVGQELQAAFLNSLPMCIDELQIQSSQGVKDFDKIIYQLTEGVGKTRGAKTGGLQKQNTWKNCFITNGEHPITNANSGGGAINRIIEYECVDKIYSDLVGLCAVIQNNYGFAGKIFVEWLQEEGNFEKINTIQKAYYRELLKSNSTEKQAASASALLAADHIATEIIFKDGRNLTISEISSILMDKSEVDVNNRAIQYLYELIARNDNKFKLNNFGEYPGEIWGMLKDDYIYIIKSVFDREMLYAGFNSTAFLSWAKRNGLLETDSGRRTKNARIGACGVVNCVCIKKDYQPLAKEEPVQEDIFSGEWETII